MNTIGAILTVALLITAGGVWEALRASRVDSRVTPAGQGRKPARVAGDGAQAHDAGVATPTFGGDAADHILVATFDGRAWIKDGPTWEELDRLHPRSWRPYE